MVTIRKATTEDAAIIADIGKVSFLESHGHSAPAPDIDVYVAKKYTVDVMRGELENTENIFHLIYCDGQIAGYSKMIFNVANEHIPDQHVTCLNRLYLLKEFYDKGLGAQLFEHNVAISKQAHQAGMWLYVWIENKRAAAFYERAGFAIMGNASFQISVSHSNPNHVMYLRYK